jgi:hypothetical protein
LRYRRYRPPGRSGSEGYRLVGAGGSAQLDHVRANRCREWQFHGLGDRRRGLGMGASLTVCDGNGDGASRRGERRTGDLSSRRADRGILSQSPMAHSSRSCQPSCMASSSAPLYRLTEPGPLDCHCLRVRPDPVTMCLKPERHHSLLTALAARLERARRRALVEDMPPPSGTEEIRQRHLDSTAATGL